MHSQAVQQGPREVVLSPPLEIFKTQLRKALSKHLLLLYVIELEALNPPVSSLNCSCTCWADGEVHAVSHPEAGTAGALQCLPTWVARYGAFIPPQNRWFCLSVPQLAAFAHGDSERHHPTLCALHQAERREAPLQVSGLSDEQKCSAL